jgi:peroxiredoxin
VAQLCQAVGKFEELNTQVVIVTFGSLHQAKRWIEDVCSPFEMLLDQKREAYRAYGLGRSLLRSWGLRTIWRYIQLLSSGRKWKGIQGDSTQLGGDFIIDTNGMIMLSHRSSDPIDRPDIKEILKVLNSAN